MTTTAGSGPLILGANGQIGRMMHRLWQTGALDFGAEPVWQVRGEADLAGQTLAWDILNEPIPRFSPTSVICLAGGPHVTKNAALARAAADIAGGAPLLYASTQAVYGPQPGVMSENSPCAPTGQYGREKLAAEKELADVPTATCLRIGNAIGADALLRAVQRGPVALDQFPDGTGPVRQMIGPKTLGQAMIDLLALNDITAPILNLAQPGLVAMADLLDAAKAPWHWVPAPDTALRSLEMDLTQITSLIAVPMADPAVLMAEVAAAGWRPQR